MTTLKCRGRYIFSDEPVEVEFDQTIASIDPVLDRDEEALSKFFGSRRDSSICKSMDSRELITIRPPATHEAIASSLRALFSTRSHALFPTVITGSPGPICSPLCGIWLRLGEAERRRGDGSVPYRRSAYLA